jgi:hypothetical protein
VDFWHTFENSLSVLGFQFLPSPAGEIEYVSDTEWLIWSGRGGMTSPTAGTGVVVAVQFAKLDFRFSGSENTDEENMAVSLRSRLLLLLVPPNLGLFHALLTATISISSSSA